MCVKSNGVISKNNIAHSTFWELWMVGTCAMTSKSTFAWEYVSLATSIMHDLAWPHFKIQIQVLPEKWENHWHWTCHFSPFFSIVYLFYSVPFSVYIVFYLYSLHSSLTEIVSSKTLALCANATAISDLGKREAVGKTQKLVFRQLVKISFCAFHRLNEGKCQKKRI